MCFPGFQCILFWSLMTALIFEMYKAAVKKTKLGAKTLWVLPSE